MELAKRTQYKCSSEGSTSFQVHNEDAEQEDIINVEEHSCTCDYFIEHKQPCHHMCVMFHETGLMGENTPKTMATFQKYWPSWALSTSLSVYCKKSVRRPTILRGKFEGCKADIILPPKQRRPRGRPRRKRFARKPTKRGRQEDRIINPWYSAHTALPFSSPDDNHCDRQQKRMRDTGV